jgi:UDPglucose 6-dehydrogenase
VKICVIGTGYVGLVTGSCFAEMGDLVTCVDSDGNKIAQLNQDQISIFEPGLESLVARNHNEGRLKFTTSLKEVMTDAEIVFITVGTPSNGDGSVNLEDVLEAARRIGELINRYMIIVSKSTVPVGTAEKIQAVIIMEMQKRKVRVDFDVVSNPEFLKEGAAVNDFMRPDRIVIGSESARAIAMMQRLYAPFMRNHDIMLMIGTRDAEMTKYVANAMLATRISFMNEIAELCEHLEVDIENVRKGVGSDTRIGYSFLYPGCGYGGSCLPKDVRALIRMRAEAAMPIGILEMVDQRNNNQKRRLFDKIVDRFGPVLEGHKFGIWGLAFKPVTDDIREAPSTVLVKLLIEAGACVQAFDPYATENFKNASNGEWIKEGKLSLVKDQYEALHGASALVLVTEWRQFRILDFDKVKQMLKTPVIFDGRNQYDPKTVREKGFEYFGIGR